MAESVEEFLTETATVPGSIGDAPLAPPPALPGMVPGDPLKPWKDIDVSAYVPVVRWLIQQGYKWAAKHDPLWAVDDEEIHSIDVPLTEATQRCLYDLRLSRIAGNPYVALLAALATLTGVKYAAIKVSQLLKEQAAREAAQNSGASRTPIQASSDQNEDGENENPNPPAAPRNRRPTSVGLTMVNGRTPGSGAASSSAASPTREKAGSLSIESEPEDE